MEPERMRKSIINLIDENKNSLVKTAFYSDPKVMDITLSLHKRWESSGRVGEPIDYALPEELKTLYLRALRVARADIDSSILMGQFFWWRREKEEKEDIRKFMRKIWGALLGRWM